MEQFQIDFIKQYKDEIIPMSRLVDYSYKISGLLANENAKISEHQKREDIYDICDLTREDFVRMLCGEKSLLFEIIQESTIADFELVFSVTELAITQSSISNQNSWALNKLQDFCLSRIFEHLDLWLI